MKFQDLLVTNISYLKNKNKRETIAIAKQFSELKGIEIGGPSAIFSVKGMHTFESSPAFEEIFGFLNLVSYFGEVGHFEWGAIFLNEHHQRNPIKDQFIFFQNFWMI